MLFPITPQNPGTPAIGAAVNVAPFGVPIEGGVGIQWEDPREIHRVVVRFRQAPADMSKLRLEYWSSRWPEQRLPKDREPGGGDVGWWELGNWYVGEWRRADTVVQADGATITFTLNPVNRQEHPEAKDYPAEFRYTLKVRVASDEPLPAMEALEAYTDSIWEERTVRLSWRNPPGELALEPFNGQVIHVGEPSPSVRFVTLLSARNPDPNTFDKTLVTARWSGGACTFALADLAKGPLLIPSAGLAVLDGADSRDYAALEREQQAAGAKTLYQRVGEMPEQTWGMAWAGIPPKRSDIYIPLGLDGGRQRFLLRADGSLEWRRNDWFLKGRPGADTPRLAWEAEPADLSFGLPGRPAHRDLVESTLPLVDTTWEQDGIRVRQEAFVTALAGTKARGAVPPADTTAVLMARFTLTNPTDSERRVDLPLRMTAGGKPIDLRADSAGLLWVGDRLRGEMTGPPSPPITGGTIGDRGALAQAQGPGQTQGSAPTQMDSAPVPTRSPHNWGVGGAITLPPHGSRQLVLKLPYVPLEGAAEQAALERLDFEREQKAVASYWRRRENESARLITPEPMLNEFYRADASHLLINCEREPGSDVRFARVGSFSYGAYGNESCMMVVDLDRRGYHKEAEECLDAWLKYQSTVGLPGDFSSQQGVLYGAGGYESGGYNQHHGWILWCLAEHYRFTRDRAWLGRAAPGILAGAEWIIRERARTADRGDLARGLLPAGSLEDIGDWWPWLSTNCYTWRGLDSAAWALEQMGHPQASHVRHEADSYHASLLAAFHEAMQRSPVVRLRDGTAVPKIPSTPYRRGRFFGWICETLEGALHLLITRAIDAHSPEAAWILNDYEDNLYLSNQWGYTVDDFDRLWFSRGGMSMQACLLLDVEPYLYRDDVKQALRALFNAIAVGYFPDARMLTEHALPNPGDWRGDHYKSSDESNAAGWLRYLFVREEGDDLLLGQAVPREWLAPGKRCGMERASTYFGAAGVTYSASKNRITAKVEGPKRNPPKRIRLRFRDLQGRPLSHVTVDGRAWNKCEGEWVNLPGDIGDVTVVASW